MKSTDSGSNRFDIARTDEYHKWDIEGWRRKYNKENRKEQERLDKEDLDHINEFYKLVNFFIKEGMYLKYPTYENLRTVVYEYDLIIKNDRVLCECARKEAIRRIEIWQIKGKRSPFISMIEKLTPEDVLTFNNIINYHKQ